MCDSGDHNLGETCLKTHKYRSQGEQLPTWATFYRTLQAKAAGTSTDLAFVLALTLPQKLGTDARSVPDRAHKAALGPLDQIQMLEFYRLVPESTRGLIK